MKTDFTKQLFWGLGVFALLFLWANVIWDFSGEMASKMNVSKFAAVADVTKNKPIESETSVPVLPKPNIRLAFVGDVMLDRGVEYSVNKNFQGDYGQLFSKVREQLRGYDFLFGNLEGPVSDKGTDGGNIYSFRMDPKVLPVLKDVGFDAVSIDNNHILNYGPEALADTKIRLKEGGVALAGENFVLAGVKIVILPFNQFADLDWEKMKSDISLAKSVNDLVIAYFHFGDEYQPEPNDYQKRAAAAALAAGADLVAGAHPHVLQPLESAGGKYIAYSLGNFIFDQYFSEATMQGGLLEVEINPQTKQIEKAILKKVLLNKKYQLESVD